MSKFRHFELNEFIKSDTAKKKNIDNCPTFEVVERLAELTEYFLEPLRCALNLPVVVHSGFRCWALNKAVGGSDTSVHPLGYAVDISCPYMAFNKFVTFVVDWVKKTGKKFDQILIETDKTTGAQWLHIGLFNSKGQQRGQIKIMNV